jgi:hypothetical protein
MTKRDECEGHPQTRLKKKATTMKTIRHVIKCKHTHLADQRVRKKDDDKNEKNRIESNRIIASPPLRSPIVENSRVCKTLDFVKHSTGGKENRKERIKEKEDIVEIEGE